MNFSSEVHPIIFNLGDLNEAHYLGLVRKSLLDTFAENGRLKYCNYGNDANGSLIFITNHRKEFFVKPSKNESPDPFYYYCGGINIKH